MAGELHRSYEETVLLGAGRKAQLVGSGNGLRLNDVLRSSLESRFGMQVQFAGHTEEAGVGAALCGSVASGAFPDIATASAEFVRYED
jgi:sedoheptulokinase